MSSIYHEQVMEHYKNPRKAGKIASADIVFSDSNPLCGDKITIHLKIKGDRVVKVSHESSGCAISQAGTSMLFEKIEGMSVKEIISLPKEELLAEFGSELSVSRVKCALLGFTAVKKALVTHRSKESKETDKHNVS